MSQSQSATTESTAAQQPTSQPPKLDYSDPRVTRLIDSYWRKNITLMAVLLVFWALVGLGCGILWADWLNQFQLGGFPLGFWFAQQGAIIAFILIILIYCIVMNGLDRKHHVELEKLRQEQNGGANG